MGEALRQRNIPITELYVNSNFAFEVMKDDSRIAHYIAMAIVHDFQYALELLMKERTCLQHAAMISEVADALTEVQNEGRFIPSLPKSWSDTTFLHVWFKSACPNLYTDSSPLVPSTISPEFRACKRILLGSNNMTLHRAFNYAHYRDFLFLLDFADKDDLQLTGVSGNTLLHKLTTSVQLTGKGDIYPTLTRRIIGIDGAASANTPNRDGKLPIIGAMVCGTRQLGVFKTLLPHTNDLNHKDSKGMSLLHYADAGAIQILAESGRVDFRSRNDKGQTVVSARIENSLFDLQSTELKALLEIEPSLAWTVDNTEHRLTPLHHAMRRVNQLDGRIVAQFLLLVPQVEEVLRAFSASTVDQNAEACKMVRQLARSDGLEEAIKVMDRIGF